MREDIVRVEEDSPDRCTAVVGGKRQCLNKKVDGENFCPAHISSILGDIKKRNIQSLYRSKWQERISEFKDDPEIRTLTQEIGICRMMLEELLNQIDDPSKMIYYHSKVTDLISKINLLVVNAQKLELNSGNLLSKTVVLNIANQIVTVISQHIENPLVLDEITNQILTVISDSTLDEEE